MMTLAFLCVDEICCTISKMPCGMLPTVLDFGEFSNMRSSDTLFFRSMRWFGHQKWVGKAHGILHFLAAPEKIDGIAFDVDFFGKRYRGDLSSHIDWNVFFFGAYAYNELLLLARVAEWMRGD